MDEIVRGIAESFEEKPRSKLDDDDIQEMINEAVEERNFKVMITDVDGRVLYKSANATENEIDLYDLIRNINNVKNDPKIEEAPMEYASLYPSKVNEMNAYVIGISA